MNAEKSTNTEGGDRKHRVRESEEGKKSEWKRTEEPLEMSQLEAG